MGGVTWSYAQPWSSSLLTYKYRPHGLETSTTKEGASLHPYTCSSTLLTVRAAWAPPLPQVWDCAARSPLQCLPRLPGCGRGPVLALGADWEQQHQRPRAQGHSPDKHSPPRSHHSPGSGRVQQQAREDGCAAAGPGDVRVTVTLAVAYRGEVLVWEGVGAWACSGGEEGSPGGGCSPHHHGQAPPPPSTPPTPSTSTSRTRRCGWKLSALIKPDIAIGEFGLMTSQWS